MSNSMDDIYGAGGGNYLKPKDLEGDNRPFFWIKSAVVETKTFNEQEGPKSMIVLSFFYDATNPLSEKKWSLNKTQALALQTLYGPYDNWAFKGVRIYKGQTTFQGQVKATIAIYPDPYQMDEATKAGAVAQLQQEQAQAQAQQPQFTGSPQAASAPGGFAPPTSQSGGFAPPVPGTKPSDNW